MQAIKAQGVLREAEDGCRIEGIVRGLPCGAETGPACCIDEGCREKQGAGFDVFDGGDLRLSETGVEFPVLLMEYPVNILVVGNESFR